MRDRATSKRAKLRIHSARAICHSDNAGPDGSCHHGQVDDRIAVQDTYPEDFAHCFGCGRYNQAGHQLKTFAAGDETITEHEPAPIYTGAGEFAYGGLIASLIDCHCVGTAMSNYYHREGREVGEGDEIWCVTGRLTVNYLAPTPIDQEVTLRARIEEVTDKKTVLKCRFYSGETQTAEGEVVAVRVPPSWRGT